MTTQDTTTVMPVRSRAALAVAGATVAPAVPWAVARIAGTDLEATTAGMTMDIGPALVLATALAMSLAGWGLLTWLLPRRGRDGRRVWTGVALTVLVLSLSGPLITEADADVRVYLLLMHLAVGAVLIPGLRAAVRD